MKLAIALAALGLITIAAGTALVYVPAGIIVAGIELVASAYVVGYLEARRETA